MTASPRPSLFIASSKDGLGVAYAIQENLDFDFEPTVWTQNVFTPTRAILDSLIARSRSADFAAFVCTPDDVAQVAGHGRVLPRDNVIFELGLFIGATAQDRCFIVHPRECTELHLPTDILGLEPLTYDDRRRDGNLVAALGPACHRIRRAARAVLWRSSPVPSPIAPTALPRLEAYLAAWTGPDLVDARHVLRAGVPFHAVEDEDGVTTRALQRIFSFLESLADAILSGEIDEAAARPIFADAVRQTWDHAYVYLAPLNQADEFWEPSPQIAELAKRWRKT